LWNRCLEHSESLTRAALEVFASAARRSFEGRRQGLQRRGRRRPNGTGL